MNDVKQAGDWFIDRSQYGDGKRYMLACVGVPKVMALISEAGMMFHDGVTVAQVRNVTADEWDKITNGAAADFERIAGPCAIEIKSPSTTDGLLVDGGRVANRRVLTAAAT